MHCYSYGAYISWLLTGYRPFFFTVAFLWLLPKTEPPDGIFDAADTRLLSGANADAKILQCPWLHALKRRLTNGPVNINVDS